MEKLVKDRPYLSLGLTFIVAVLVNIAVTSYTIGVRDRILTQVMTWQQENQKLPERVALIEQLLAHPPRLTAIEQGVARLVETDVEVKSILCKLSDRMTQMELQLARHTSRDKEK